MIYGLYQSAAGMFTTQYRQDVIANNLANAETVGFKRDIATFAERQPASVAGRRDGPSNPDLAGLAGGLWLGQTYTDFGVGQFVPTNNATDVALQGPGFLTVQTPQGPQYTRDGRMVVGPDGLLAAATDGAPMSAQGGAAIRVNPTGGPLTIDTAGGVWQDGTLRGALEVVNFPNYDDLRKAGTARFTAPTPAAVPAPAVVQQGYVENAGVQPVNELVSMIDAAHAYELNARMVSLQDDSLGKLIGATLRA